MEIDKTTGAISWIDYTVPDAGELKSFYEAVVGWKSEPVSMGEYDDFNMTSPADGVPRAGVCHHRGGNTGIPPVWMVYINVANLDESIAAVEKGGGAVILGPKSMGKARYCIIRDPAGAHCALFDHGE